MSEAVYTKQDLTVMQGWPLARKIQETRTKIRKNVKVRRWKKAVPNP